MGAPMPYTGTTTLIIEDAVHEGGFDSDTPACQANNAAGYFQHIVDYTFTFVDPDLSGS